MAAELPLRQADALGDLPAQVGREAPPEGTSVRVRQDGGFVVVVVGARVKETS